MTNKHGPNRAKLSQSPEPNSPRDTAGTTRPERLWLWPECHDDGMDKAVSFPDQLYPSGSTEYIRADLATPAPVVPAEGPISTLEMVCRNMPDIPELPEAYQPRNIARNLAALRSAPLLDAGITKEGTLAIVQRDGIDLPRSYAMGFPNANCLGTGCGKATSPDYWALYRLHFPENFARTAAYARKIGAKLTRIRGVRCFIDEIPLDWPVTQPISPVCDFLCAMIDPDQEGGDDADQG